MTNKEYRKAMKEAPTKRQPVGTSTKPMAKVNPIKVTKQAKSQPAPSTITPTKIRFANERLKNIKK